MSNEYTSFDWVDRLDSVDNQQQQQQQQQELVSDQTSRGRRFVEGFQRLFRQQTPSASASKESLDNANSQVLDSQQQQSFLYTQKHWMPDEHCNQCYECNQRFSLFLRRHHCRVCGRIFCDKCSSHLIDGRAIGLAGGMQRACAYCARNINGEDTVLQQQQQQSLDPVQQHGQQLSSGQASVMSGISASSSNNSLSTITGGSLAAAAAVAASSMACMSPSVSSSMPTLLPAASPLPSSVGSAMAVSSIGSNGLATISSSSAAAVAASVSSMATGLDFQGPRLPQQPPSLKFILTVWNSVVSPKDGVILQRRKDGGVYFFGRDLLDWLLAGGHCNSHENALNWAAVFLQHRCFAPAMSSSLASTVVGSSNVNLTTGLALSSTASASFSSSSSAAAAAGSTLVSASSSTGLVSLGGGIEFSDTMLYRVLRGHRPVQAVGNSTLLSPSWLNDIAEPSTPSAAGAISAAVSPAPSPTPDATITDVEFYIKISDSPPKADLVDESAKYDPEKEIKEIVKTADEDQRQPPPEVQTGALKQAYQDHLRDLVRQEISKSQVSLSWSDVICDLADQVAQQLPRGQSPLDSLRVKIASSGRKTDSFAFPGLVFSKNVLRKGMPTERGPGAAVLLLACSLEFERNENKLTCLEPQMMQETQYLRRCVDRIGEFEPKIVMVERTVALVAQEFLSELGVTLFANVKQSVLRRVGRLCGAEILDSVDRLVNRSQLGCCAAMSVKQLSLGPGMATKSCVFLSSAGCPAYQSVLLHGRRLAQLKRVKSALITAVHCRYAMRTELAYALDFRLRPPQGLLMMLLDDDDNDDDQLKIKKAAGIDTDGSTLPSPVRASSTVPSQQVSADNSNVGVSENSGDNIQLRPQNQQQQQQSPSSPSVLRHLSVPVMDSSDPLQQAADSAAIQPDDDAVTVDEPVANAAVADAAVSSSSDEFRRQLAASLLSASPFIRLAEPHLETPAGRSGHLAPHLRRRISPPTDSSALGRFAVTESERYESAVTSKMRDFPTKLALHSFQAQPISLAFNSEGFDDALVAYRRADLSVSNSSANTNNTTNSNKENLKPSQQQPIDMFSLLLHQRFGFLLCAYAPGAPNYPRPCRDPQLWTVDMYGRGDVRLLDFLERFCFQPERKCDELSHIRSPDRQAGHLRCHLPLAGHTRRFVAESGYVTLVVRPNKTAIEGDDNTIFVRSWCRRCRPQLKQDEQQQQQQQQQQTASNRSQLVPLSDDAKALSFAQFLRLHFSEHRLSTSACRHSMHADHVQYFYKAQAVACFDYTPVCLRSIVTPTTSVVVPLDITRQLLESHVSRLTTSGYRLLADIQSIYVTHAYAQKETISRLNALHSECNAELRAFFDIDRLTAGPEAAAVALNRKAVLFKHWLTALIDRWQTLLQDTLNVDQMPAIQPAISSSSASSSSNVAALAGTALTSAMISEPSASVAAESTGVTPPQQQAQPTADIVAEQQQQQQQQMQRKSSRSVLAKRPNSSNTAQVTIPRPDILPNTETYFVPPMVTQPVCVYANDPSSIIAFALSSAKHQDFVQHACFHLSGELPVNMASNGSNIAAAAAANTGHSRVPSDQTSASTDLPSDHVKYNPTQRVVKLGNHAASAIDGNSIEQSLTGQSRSPGHKKDLVEIEVSGPDVKIYCRVHHACKFHGLRRDIIPQGESAFLHSLSRSSVWATTGGKSRASFYKTTDDRFVLKKVSDFESDSLELMAPHYCQYVCKRLRSGLPCCLAKIVGMFFLAYSNPKCAGSQLKGTYVVMENLLFNCRVDRVFDLKGSERNRHLTDDGQTVLLDQNFADASVEEPLFVRRPEWLVLQRALHYDTNFLRQHNIMDYSLIVGICDDQVVCGIVDYIRDFTLDKMVEYLWKKMQSESLPTVINPVLYQERFLAAMNVNFLPVPSHWDSFELYECNFTED